MMSWWTVLAGLLFCGSLPLAGDDEPVVPRPPVVASKSVPEVRLSPMFDGQKFQRPVDARQAPGDERSWYVVEQRGLIQRMIPGIQGWVALPWLDIREKVSRRHNEEGLLGLAFSPYFAEEGHPHEGVFYVNYSVKPGRASHLSRFRLLAEGDGADAASEEILLVVPQPYGNHNGGGLVFGPDGHLYFSLGDGGLYGDPDENAENPSTLLGSILRLDVSPQIGGGYRVPPDNPFVDAPEEGAGEVWAWGLRNAWRFSFDRKTGEMWAGDVGQNLWEFVFVVKPGGNHGWDVLEGFHRYELAKNEDPPEGLTHPIFEYPHDDPDYPFGNGLSITGGFVYRGKKIPALVGWYLFGDYATRDLWAIRRRPDGSVEHATLLEDGANVSSFAEGHDGELLVIHHMGGPIYRLSPDS